MAFSPSSVDPLRHVNPQLKQSSSPSHPTQLIFPFLFASLDSIFVCRPYLKAITHDCRHMGENLVALDAKWLHVDLLGQSLNQIGSGSLQSSPSSS